MTHLTPDELIDAMEGVLADTRHAHLSSCPECGRQLADLSSMLGEAQRASIPDPSPLFWRYFSQRVNAAIDTAPATAESPGWLRWQVLLPIGAMAVVLLAFAFTMKPTEIPREVATSSTLSLELPDESWTTVAELVGEIDLETASAAGVIEPGVAEQAALVLSAEEQQELTRL
ncbi:MAG TPA: hypothetical protein VF491_06215, partial [Vicinamibacterales bacterium]